MAEVRTDVRAPKLEELDTVTNFLDENLRSEQQWSILSEYPMAFSSRNLDNIRIVEEQGKILSHAVIKRLMIKTPVGLFNVAAIGSVVTCPEHRGQGHSQAVLQSCLQRADEQNCDFAILWTDLYDFYRKLSFELAGREVSMVIEKDFTTDTTGLNFLQTTRVDPQALLKVYTQHTVGTVRSAQDFQKFLTIPNTRLWTAWDQQNQLKAYAVVGRGADLTNYVHEWGGGVQELMALFSHIRKTMNTTITVIVPRHSSNLIDTMMGKGITRAMGFLGMIKPIHHEHLIFKAHRLARSMGFDQFVLEKQDENYIFGFKDKLYRLSGEAAFTRLMFGPDSVDELSHVDSETKEAFSKIFPFPMWIWGWDSV